MKAAEYHEQFAARIIKALAEGTAPWQKPWKAGERILPHNFASGRDYRGGNAVYLAMNGLDRGYADPLHGDPYGAARPRPFRPGHQPGGGRRTPPRRRAEPLRARAGRKGKRDGWRKRRSSVSGCCQPRSSWPATSSCWRMSSGRAGAAALGESGPMQDLKAKIPRVAASPFPVVIEGESGTGKELICGCRRTARSEGSAKNRTQRLDLRVVAATNRPLDAEAAAGRFRSDLLYRLEVLRLRLRRSRLQARNRGGGGCPDHAPERRRPPPFGRTQPRSRQPVAEALGMMAPTARHEALLLVARRARRRQAGQLRRSRRGAEKARPRAAGRRAEGAGPAGLACG